MCSVCEPALPYVLCTCRSISLISVNLSRRSMGSCSITARRRKTAYQASPARLAAGAAQAAKLRQLKTENGLLKPVTLSYGPILTFEIILKVQHRAQFDAFCVLWNAFLLPKWRRQPLSRSEKIWGQRLWRKRLVRLLLLLVFIGGRWTSCGALPPPTERVWIWVKVSYSLTNKPADFRIWKIKAEFLCRMSQPEFL